MDAAWIEGFGQRALDATMTFVRRLPKHERARFKNGKIIVRTACSGGWLDATDVKALPLTLSVCWPGPLAPQVQAGSSLLPAKQPVASQPTLLFS